MATKQDNIELDIAHFNNFKEHIPGYSTFDEDTVMEMLTLGLIQVSTAFEHAVAGAGGHIVESVDGQDLSDGSECKMATVRTSGYGQNYSANISSVHNKTGVIRAQVYERLHDTFYYFAIPHYAYSHITKTSNIDIPFHTNGQPKRIATRRLKSNWWDYEVKDFATMSN